jgi:hypothetical protein
MSKKQFFTLIVPALFIGALSVFATDAPEKIGFPMTLVSSLVAFLGSTTYLYLHVVRKRSSAQSTQNCLF